jgi:hypothetical protein
MISIIISSANAEQLKRVTENVTATIGVPFEIITTDNSRGEKGICEIYNHGAKKAKYDILCFMHEDVNIHTRNWGGIVISTFADNPKLGLIGIAGTAYKPIAPSGWEGFGAINLYVNIIQSYKYKKRDPDTVNINPTNERLPRVACVDGVWLCAPKKVALEHPFDEALFKGFHCYDIDFSFSVAQAYEIAVTYDILLNHFSEGNYNQAWVDENIKLHKKWAHHLPVNLQGLTDKEQIKAEKMTFKSYVDKLITLNCPAKAAYTILYMGNKYWSLSPKLFFKMAFYTFKRFLKLVKV